MHGLAWQRVLSEPFLGPQPHTMLSEAVTTPDILLWHGQPILYVGAVHEGHERLMAVSLPDKALRYARALVGASSTEPVLASSRAQNASGSLQRFRAIHRSSVANRMMARFRGLRQRCFPCSCWHWRAAPIFLPRNPAAVPRRAAYRESQSSFLQEDQGRQLIVGGPALFFVNTP